MRRVRKYTYVPGPPAAAIRVILLAVTALLLQLGMGKAVHALDDASQPADSVAVVAYVPDCGDHDCLTHGCMPQQGCSTSGGAACHSPCAQTPLLVMSTAVFLVSSPATTGAGKIPGPGTRRLDTPFRPPA